MGEKAKKMLGEKIDVKITGYISTVIFGLTAAAFLVLIGLSASRSGELPGWAAAAGFGVIAVNLLAIKLSKWGQAQTGRRLTLNKTAVWLNRAMIVVMLAVYALGIAASMG